MFAQFVRQGPGPFTTTRAGESRSVEEPPEGKERPFPPRRRGRCVMALDGTPIVHPPLAPALSLRTYTDSLNHSGGGHFPARMLVTVANLRRQE
jgi:hypothetical protein